VVNRPSDTHRGSLDAGGPRSSSISTHQPAASGQSIVRPASTSTRLSAPAGSVNTTVEPSIATVPAAAMAGIAAAHASASAMSTPVNRIRAIIELPFPDDLPYAALLRGSVRRGSHRRRTAGRATERQAAMNAQTSAA